MQDLTPSFPSFRQFELPGYIYASPTGNHCALRAPTVFLVRINTIRTKNTVMDKSNNGSQLRQYSRRHM